MPQASGRIMQADIEANFVRIQKAHEETERVLRESIEEANKKLNESTFGTTKISDRPEALRYYDISGHIYPIPHLSLSDI